MGEAKRRQQTGAPAPRPNAKRGGGRAWIIVGITVVILGIGLALLTAPPSPTSDELPVASEDTPPFPAQLDEFGTSTGPADATVVVREFADYQCPACGRFADATERLREEYVDTGNVRFVYFDLPLQQHANAVPAAMAARCAGDQDAYWPMHERLFAEQSQWSEAEEPLPLFTGYADDLSLNARRFNTCMTTDLHQEAIGQSREAAVSLRVTSTPTVYVNNIRLTNASWAQLSAVVERELKAASN